MELGIKLVTIGVLFFITVWIAIEWQRSHDRGSISTLFGFLILLDVVFVTVFFLNTNIKTSYITVEQADKIKEEVQVSKQEIEKLTNLNLKMGWTLAEGGSTFGGLSPKSIELLKKTTDDIHTITGVDPGKVDPELQEIINRVNEIFGIKEPTPKVGIKKQPKKFGTKKLSN